MTVPPALNANFAPDKFGRHYLRNWICRIFVQLPRRCLGNFRTGHNPDGVWIIIHSVGRQFWKNKQKIGKQRGQKGA
jgi:hypothetical protein